MFWKNRKMIKTKFCPCLSIIKLENTRHILLINNLMQSIKLKLEKAVEIKLTIVGLLMMNCILYKNRMNKEKYNKRKKEREYKNKKNKGKNKNKKNCNSS